MMGQSIIKIYSFIQVEECIRKIERYEDFTIYQSTEFLKLFRRSMNFRIIGFRPEFNSIGKTYYVANQQIQGKYCCVLPFQYDKKKNEVSFIGDQKQLNNAYYNHDIFTYERFVELMDFIFEKYEGCMMKLINMSQRTLFFSYLQKYIANSTVKVEKYWETACVSVHICNNNADDWFASLSKSARQNIRTSYNRIKTDNKLIEIKHLRGTEIRGDVVRQAMRLQRKRNLEKRSISFGKFTNLICAVGGWLSMLNVRTKMLLQSERSYTCVLFIDKQMAAFVAGYLSPDGRFYIPFLKYNTIFSRYNPGIIIINESIRWLCASDYNLQEYDLLTGEEQYKYSYGGKKYTNINIYI